MVANCFPGGQFVSVLSKDLLKLEPPIENVAYGLDLLLFIQVTNNKDITFISARLIQWSIVRSNNE